MWVSHVMQRLAAGMLCDAATQSLIADAGTHYAARNRAFVAQLAARGVHAQGDDGLNVWVDVQGDTAEPPVASRCGAGSPAPVRSSRSIRTARRVTRTCA